MSRESQDAKGLETLKKEYQRISPLVWADLWGRFCGISFDENPQITSFKEGRRQVVNYMLGMADKLSYPEMEALWKKGKGSTKIPASR